MSPSATPTKQYFGATVPVLPNGQININALLNSTVKRDPWRYYSTLKLANGTVVAPQYQLFNAAVGQPDPNPLVGGPATQTLTKVETNMPQSCTNGFGAPRDLIMDGLGFYFKQVGPNLQPGAVGGVINSNELDMISFANYCYFEFKIIDAIFLEGALEFKPGGLGFYGVSTTRGQQVYSLGITNIHTADRVTAQYAKYLAPLLTWSLTLYLPANAGPGGAALTLLTTAQAGAGLQLMAYISGLTDRAIQ